MEEHLSSEGGSRGLVAALLSPPTVTIQLPLKVTKFKDCNFTSSAVTKRTCCLCQEPWDHEEGPFLLVYDLDLVKATLIKEMDKVGLDLEDEDLTFCAFCHSQLQGLVKLRREMDRLEQRLASMITGLLTLLSKEEEDEEPLGGVELNEGEELIVPDDHDRDGRRVRRRHTSDTWVCPLCNKSLGSKYSLERHTSLVHSSSNRPHPRFNPNPKRFYCQSCSSSFNNALNLSLHVKTHDDDGPKDPEEEGTEEGASGGKSCGSQANKRPLFSCPDCPKTFRRPQHVKIHSFVHNAEGAKPFPCLHCSATFSHRSGFNNHVARVHFPQRYKRFPCPSCQKPFGSKFDLGRHSKICTSRTKDAEGRFPCHLCDRSFLRALNLTQHLKVHSEGPRAEKIKVKEKRFSCPVCNKAFFESSQLKVHSVVHTRAKPYRCTICAATFTQGSAVRTHVSRVHFPEKSKGRRFPCPVCKKPFWTSYDLKRHSVSCTGIHHTSTAFPCRLCPRTFRRSRNLSRHLGAVHFPHGHCLRHPCTLCGKVFWGRAYLRNHLKAHAGRTVAANEKDTFGSPTCEGNQDTVVVTDKEDPNIYILGCPKEEDADSKPMEPNKTTSVDADATSGSSISPDTFPLDAPLLASKVPKERFPCSAYTKSFTTPGQHERHFVVHTRQKHFYCSFCSATFTQASSARRHINRAHHQSQVDTTEGDGSIVMNEERSNDADDDIDVKQQAIPRSLETLLSMEEENDEEPLGGVVVQVGEEFIVPDDHDDRNRRRRQSSDMWVCNKSLGSKCSLEGQTTLLHSSSNRPTNNPNSKRYHCQICSRFFNTALNLSLHVKSHNSKGSNEGIDPGDISGCSNKEKESPGKSKTEPLFLCPDCPKTFRRPNHVRIHSFVHTAEGAKPFPCLHCPATFSTRSGFNKHLNRLHFPKKDKRFPCPSCQNSFGSKYDLGRHFKICTSRNTDGEGRFPCHFCDRSFLRAVNLTLHLKAHSRGSDEKRFPCHVCNKAFNKTSQLRTHVSRVHILENPMGRRQFPCSLCKKPFRSSHALETHSGSCTGIHHSSNIFPCRLCPRTFSLSSNLSRHLRAVHFPKRPSLRHPCTLCGKVFWGRGHLKNHLKAHEGNPIPSNEKDTLESQKTDEGNQGNRKTIYEDDDIDVKQEAILRDDDDCRVQQMTTINDDANTHEKAAVEDVNGWHLVEEVQPFNEGSNPADGTLETRKASKPKRLSCSICSKSFNKMSNLKRHSSFCSKPGGLVTCPICDRTFAKEGYLKAHIKAKHPLIVFPKDDEAAGVNKTTNNPSEPDGAASKVVNKTCPVCNKTFMRASRLKEHSVVHTKEKPFPCTLCPQVFSQRSGLTGHVRRIHFPETAKRFPCSVCKKTFGSPADLKRHSVSCANTTEWVRTNADVDAKVETILPDDSTIDDSSFTCRLCSRSFTSYTNLGRHVTQSHFPKHQRQLKYPCTLCDKVFWKKGHLSNHSLSHRTTKPIKCPKCPRRFYRKGHLDMHIKIHQSKQPERPEEENESVTDSLDE